jgi:ribosomal protein S18 acetylase RimI-like enzyme
VTELALTVRDFEAEDLADLEWSGGPEHVNAVAEAVMASYQGQAVVLAVALPNGRLIANGVAYLRGYPDAAELLMLSVHETFQNLGVGTRLIAALEERVRDHGVTTARLGVEHDNPRAAALYRRLGYREVGSALDSWPVAGGRTYVTVTSVLERRLEERPQ